MNEYTERNFFDYGELFDYIESSLAGARDTYNSFACNCGYIMLDKETYERAIRNIDKMFDKINPWSPESEIEEASEPFVMPQGGEGEYIF